MNATYKFRKAIFKAISGSSEDHPLIQRMEAHQERLANDPALAGRREQMRAESRRSLSLQLAVATFIAIPVVWFACARLLPFLF